MEKSKFPAVIFILLIASAGTCFAGGTPGGRALDESARASWHASAGLAHGIVASGQAVSAVAAVPFAIAGSVGGVSTEVANGLVDAATAPVGCPLPVTDETVTAGVAPNEALKSNGAPDR